MVFSFSLVIAELSSFSEEQAEALFEAGCDDCTPSVRAGVVIFDFDREGETPQGAIEGALQDVGKVGLRVERIEPDDLVTQSEIARRLDRSRESIRQLVHGERHDGGFPRPVAAVTGTSPLWSWCAVVDWCIAKGICRKGDRNIAECILRINEGLKSRRKTPAPAARHAGSRLLAGAVRESARPFRARGRNAVRSDIGR